MIQLTNVFILYHLSAAWKLLLSNPVHISNSTSDYANSHLKQYVSPLIISVSFECNRTFKCSWLELNPVFPPQISSINICPVSVLTLFCLHPIIYRYALHCQRRSQDEHVLHPGECFRHFCSLTVTCRDSVQHTCHVRILFIRFSASSENLYCTIEDKDNKGLESAAGLCLCH